MPLVKFPTARGEAVRTEIGRRKAVIERVDIGTDAFDGARVAVYSLTIDGLVIVHSTADHISKLLLSLEQDAAYADQAELDEERAKGLQKELERKLDEESARMLSRKVYANSMGSNKREWYWVKGAAGR